MTRSILTILSIYILLISGCGKDPALSERGAEKASTGARLKKIRIAVIPKGTTHEFWKSIHAGANKAGRSLGVEIIWKGPVREDDRDEQIKVVENLIASRVDGIVLAPLDDAALARPASDAAREGIPVVIIDSDIKWKERVSFVATDNYRGGAMAAERLGERLKGRGRVMMLRYQEGSASTTQREAGFLETIASKFPKIEIVSSNRYGGATTETSYGVSENLLIKYRALQGIFCPNESTTFGMLRALQDAGRADKLFFVGFDSSVKLVQALHKGEIDALVLQNPFRMGELGVQTLLTHIRGEKVAPRIDTGVVLATKENMQQPEIRQLLSPDLTLWLK
ncbi:MAG: substrate-binding domain-containing protein [Deltaproteobacteria bacterium]|nr:substrate-binding domain-containing protein [Deltaproteobacteria bacterium]